MMKQLRELRFVLSISGMEMNLEKLLGKIMSGYYEKGESNKFVIKTSRKHASMGGV